MDIFIPKPQKSQTKQAQKQRGKNETTGTNKQVLGNSSFLIAASNLIRKHHQLPSVGLTKGRGTTLTLRNNHRAYFGRTEELIALVLSSQSMSEERIKHLTDNTVTLTAQERVNYPFTKPMEKGSCPATQTAQNFRVLLFLSPTTI